MDRNTDSDRKRYRCMISHQYREINMEAEKEKGEGRRGEVREEREGR